MKLINRYVWRLVSLLLVGQTSNYSVNRTQIPLRGLCAGYLKR
jgi:hypothetical protein